MKQLNKRGNGEHFEDEKGKAWQDWWEGLYMAFKGWASEIKACFSLLYNPFMYTAAMRHSQTVACIALALN